MPTVRAHGISADLPRGFEGRIFRRPATGPERPYPVAHFATFPLPPDTADFGGGAVDRMGPLDIFVVLFEYGPESLGAPLFERVGMPRSLSPAQFRPYTIRRGLGGQSGTQWFFTENDRPFTLYAVLGGHSQRFRLLPRLNALLASIAVAPAVAPQRLGSVGSDGSVGSVPPAGGGSNGGGQSGNAPGLGGSSP